MQFSEEQIKKAFAAKSAEELLETAKAEGFSLTKEEVEHYFKVLHAGIQGAKIITRILACALLFGTVYSR